MNKPSIVLYESNYIITEFLIHEFLIMYNSCLAGSKLFSVFDYLCLLMFYSFVFKHNYIDVLLTLCCSF